MTFTTLLCCAFIGIALFAQLARAEEPVNLRPFVGETTREFEARKRGIALNLGNGEGDTLIVPADASGHFFLQAALDGQQIRMLIDTGASVVALSYEDAEIMLLSMSDREFTEKVMTANGLVEAAPARIAEIQVGGIAVRDVEALVLPPGRLKTSLLGMNFLNRLSAFEISGGRLVLRR